MGGCRGGGGVHDEDSMKMEKKVCDVILDSRLRRM